MPTSRDDTTQLQAIVGLAAQGNEGAYGELIARASERLLKLTRKMLRQYPRLRRWEQSDDVFQTAALRLHRSLAEVRPQSVRSFFGLAATQIRRTLIDLARHHFGPEGQAAKHHTDECGRVADDGNRLVENLPDHSASPKSLGAWADFHEAVERLPTEERDVFELLWYGGMQQKEIAELLGVSVPTVQRRWYRGRLLMKEALEGICPPVKETREHG